MSKFAYLQLKQKLAQGWIRDCAVIPDLFQQEVTKQVAVLRTDDSLQTTVVPGNIPAWLTTIYNGLTCSASKSRKARSSTHNEMW